MLAPGAQGKPSFAACPPSPSNSPSRESMGGCCRCAKPFTRQLRSRTGLGLERGKYTSAKGISLQQQKEKNKEGGKKKGKKGGKERYAFRFCVTFPRSESIRVMKHCRREWLWPTAASPHTFELGEVCGSWRQSGKDRLALGSRCQILVPKAQT